jgi:ABC-2 type transport system permease protein
MNSAATEFLTGLRMQVRLATAVPYNYIPAIVQPVAYLVILRGTRNMSRPATADELVIGVGLLAVWGTVLWTCGMMLRWDAATGVLNNVLATQIRPWLLLLGRGAGAGCFAVVAITCSLGVTLVITGTHLSGVIAADTLIAAPLTVISAAGLGLLFCSSLITSRRALRNLEILTYPFFIISGLLVPARSLPCPLNYAWIVIPLQWISRMLQGLASVDVARTALAAAMWLLLSIAYYCVGCWLLRRALERLRRTGTIEHV